MLFRYHWQMIGILMVCFLLLLSYFNALSGPFILDDFTSVLPASISELSIAELQRVALADSSGPFGRFIPVLSFALNDYFWGDAPYSFKVVNLFLHFLNFCLVFRLVVLVLQKSSSDENALSSKEIFLLAITCASLWALHPMQMSSVMYVVQRMAMMSTTFTLCALIIYLQFRDRPKSRNTKAIWLVSLAGFTVVSCICKEIGVLTVLYILLLEFLFFSNLRVIYFNFTNGKIFSILFSVLLLLLFWGIFQQFIPQYEYRDFGLMERLLSQAHIVVNFYLKNIMLPSLDDLSVYHDGYVPISSVDFGVIISLLVLVFLMGLLIYARKKYPVVSIGVGIFFISHLLESTFLPLELVFEHRNYLSILGVCLVVVYSLWLAVRTYHVSRMLVAFLILLPISFLMQQTYVRSLEWSSKESLISSALVNKPFSIRAKMAITESLAEQGRLSDLLVHLESAAVLHPENSIFSVQRVLFSGASGIENGSLLVDTIEQLKTAPLRTPDVKALQELYGFRADGRFQWPSIDQITELFAAAVDNKNKMLKPNAELALYGMNAEFQLKSGRLKGARESLVKGLAIDGNNLNINLMLAKIFLAEGNVAEARKVLAVAKSYEGIISQENQEFISQIESIM